MRILCGDSGPERAVLLVNIYASDRALCIIFEKGDPFLVRQNPTSFNKQLWIAKKIEYLCECQTILTAYRMFSTFKFAFEITHHCHQFCAESHRITGLRGIL